MELNFSPEHEAYRAELRDFLKREWNASRDPAAIRRFRERAVEEGHIYRWVPRRYGGAEQPPDPVRNRIVNEEFDAVRAPGEIRQSGVKMVPTLLEHGTEEQKERFIRSTLLGDFIWCQGYSEPGSGSDLASLRTSAVLEGDEWVINGQKIWTSNAHIAHFMFILVRTEPDQPRHAGISYLLLDMTRPGISVRPLKQITGDASFNEVFFDNVRTPADWIVGERGQGWKVSRTTLKFERDSIGSAQTTERLFDNLVKLAQRTQRDGRPLIQHDDVRQALTRLEGFVLAQKVSSIHQLSLSAEGRDAPLLGLVTKLAATDIGHEVARLSQSFIGDDALAMPHGKDDARPDAKWVNQIMGSLGISIAGGTSNIQRNIIAERGLDLPREEAGQ
jgi:alkylation response protein AidB-like acyl-CoA dehydrogenase